MMTLTMGTASQQGSQRNVNQDCVFTHVYDEQVALALIADGLGSYTNSAEASSLACAITSQHLMASHKAGRLDRAALAAAIQAANLALWQRGFDEHITLKTTLSLVAYTGADAYIAHVGDCRVYRLRDGALTQLTKDHSRANDGVLQRMLRGVTKSNGNSRHVLSRVVGDHPIVRADLHSITTQADDRFILCCDGVWSALEETELRRIVALEADDDAIALQLVQAAQARGSTDDVSAVVLSVHR